VEKTAIADCSQKKETKRKEERPKESLSFCIGKTGWLLRKTEKERDGDRQKEMAGETQRLATKVSGQKEFFYLDFCGNVPSLFTPSLRLTLFCSSTECVELGFCNHTDTHSTYTETPKWSSKRDDK